MQHTLQEHITLTRADTATPHLSFAFNFRWNCALLTYHDATDPKEHFSLHQPPPPKKKEPHNLHAAGRRDVAFLRADIVDELQELH